MSRVRPKDRAGFVEAVDRARSEGWSVRAVGASHSHSRLAAPDGLLVETDGWQGLNNPVDRPAAPGQADWSTIEVRAGTRIHQLGEPLYQLGRALINQGDIDQQSVAGAVATGTHGTGPTLQNMSAAVKGLRLVLADGEVVDCDPVTEPDLFEVARHGLGGVGLVTDVVLATRPRYRLHERQWVASPDEVMADIDDLVAATRHFEFFWVPDRDLCLCKSLAEVPTEDETEGRDPGAGMTDRETGATDLGPEPVEQLGKRERRGWSHQIFPSVRDDRHTEMEYGVPADRGPDCFAALRELIGRRFTDLTWPVEYRTLAADDQLISVAAGRPTVTLSVHEAVANDDRPLFEACEEVFDANQGRPHWGKVHYRDGPALEVLHPGYRRWWALRDRYDPNGVFVTADLLALRP